MAARNFSMFRELCGDTTLKNVILVTNMWGEIPQDVGEAREREITTGCLKPALDKGAQLVRHYNTIQSAHDIVRSILRNKPAAAQIQREMVEECRDIDNTAAGETINKELIEEIKRHQADVEAMKVPEKKDTRQELVGETRRVQEEVNGMVNSKTIAARYEEERRKLEEEMDQKEREKDYYHDDMAVFQVCFLVFL